MYLRTFCLILLGILLPIDDATSDDAPVRYSTEIAPLIKKNCVACHNESTDEGGVNLESVDRMIASDADDVLVPGQPEASRLYLLASHAEDPVMPPEDNDVSASPLTAEELERLARWIRQGARVDSQPMEDSPQSWQPLPANLKNVYTSAMTDDGRLAAVAFGNEIGLFDAASDNPIGLLRRAGDGTTQPAHDDFVQDLTIRADGRRIISTGYRNIKVWDARPFEPIEMPALGDDSLAITVNHSGSHLAVLSPRGELSVAELGRRRWQWMKGFDLPGRARADDAGPIRLALDPAGHRAVVAMEKEIWVARADAIGVEQLASPVAITAVAWIGGGRFVTGNHDGSVSIWQHAGGGWANRVLQVFDQAVATVSTPDPDSDRWVATDSTGRVAVSDDSEQGFADSGKLPGAANAVVPNPGGDMLWVATTSGALGRFQLKDQSYVEVATADPAAAELHARDQWAVLVGEKYVAADEAELKKSETNAAAETKSLETIAKDIESKRGVRDTKANELAEAKTASESASKKLAEAKSAQQSNDQKRTELKESIDQLASSIKALEQQLAELNQQKAADEKELAAIPAMEKLAEAVKAADEASKKAEQSVTAKRGERDAAVRALEAAEQAQGRGEKRLAGLNEEIERRKAIVEQTKAEQEQRTQAATASKQASDQAKASDSSIALLGDRPQLVSLGPQTGKWSLWSESGNWLAETPELRSCKKLLAAGRRAAVFETESGQIRAMRFADSTWNLSYTIGSSRGESPFADRVLCVDFASNPARIVTGGGQPSRNGELMIWSADDGSLVQKMEKPHGDTVLCVRFSPDGKRLASGGADRLIKIWDVETGEWIKTLEGHTHHVTSIDWHVNGRQLSSGSADATIKVWDVETGQASRTISGLKSEVTRLSYVGRDDRIGVASGDGRFRVYRTDNGRLETNVGVPGGYLYALDSNRDGTRFVIGGADGNAVVVDKAGKTLRTYQLTQKLDDGSSSQ